MSLSRSSSQSLSTTPSPQCSRFNLFLARLEHMTFAWFTSCMSLGGIANLLMARIFDSDIAFGIGAVLFAVNVCYLIALFSLQIVRYTMTPASLLYTLSHPIECCFVPTALLACATAIIGLSNVAGNNSGKAWEVVLRVLFWIYFVASIIVSLVCYTFLFSRAEQSLHHMNPAWVLPIFPAMLCGTIASSVVPMQSPSAALAIAVCGLTCQGLGFIVSIMMYAVLLLRLMTHSYPPSRARPGLFMNVGPPAFTIICLLGLSSEMQRILPALSSSVSLPANSYEILSVTALAASVLLWSLSAWFYLFTVASLIDVMLSKKKRGEMEFILAWWACVFPVSGFVLATQELGEAFNSTAINVVAQCMLVWLVIVFVMVAVMHARAVIRGTIMKDGVDEDRVIDTMYGRFEPAATTHDVEKAQEEQQQQQQRIKQHSPYSNPPTYPSTPAASVSRLDMKKPEHAQRDSDDDIDAIQPLPPASSSSGTSTPWSSQLKMTPLSVVS
ncbi:uncharacterized protein UMAG_05764 [Mycosarcoma maydis]|uniref:Malic acid transport protein n=1 Tax=Mycosarcoma maydis TaxID=5270 RepID=A0A0D1BYV2_MYCMD|nr:uncharacterized protein UMAG_05764 [Ustilago maydis 521]KIS66982.1 hypothetical protein UMAG_05764 [Ustilago maydis 521]|eukprot:XP_011391499.1 hypothetical protein UMAG_05764 [Ustilago maydis 521]